MSTKGFPYLSKTAFIEEGEKRLEELQPRENNELILSNNAYSSEKKKELIVFFIYCIFEISVFAKRLRYHLQFKMILLFIV